MLHESFYWLVNMSISAALCGVIVLLLRRVKRLPRRICVLLWAIPLFRMLIPYGVRGKMTLMHLTTLIRSKDIPLPNQHGDPFTQMNHMGLAADYFPVDYRTESLYRIFDIGGLIWLTVAAALIIAFFIIYFITLSELKDAIFLADGVYVSPKVTSPAVYGIIRPRIILPSEEYATELILLHEKTHIKRADNLWRLVAFTVASIHWFNPLAWVFLKAFLADTELACDEAVLSRCGEERKQEYALALIGCAEKKSVFASAFGGARLRVRAESIMSYKKLTAAATIAFSVLIICVFYVLLAN